MVTSWILKTEQSTVDAEMVFLHPNVDRTVQLEKDTVVPCKRKQL